MKKRYLKGWVEYLLMTIQCLLIMLLASETEDLKLFILSKIVFMIVFLINHLILVKYSRLYESEI